MIQNDDYTEMLHHGFIRALDSLERVMHKEWSPIVELTNTAI